MGEHANNYAEIAAKDKLTELQLRVRQLVEQVEQIQKEQNYQRVSITHHLNKSWFIWLQVKECETRHRERVCFKKRKKKKMQAASISICMVKEIFNVSERIVKWSMLKRTLGAACWQDLLM